MDKREARRIMGLPSALQHARILYRDDRLLAAHQRTAEEIEKELRSAWDKKGVSRFRQDAIIAEVNYKASPAGLAEMKANLFPPIQGKLFRLQNYEQRGLAL